MKNYFLTSDRSLTRKLKEIVISVKIDQQQSKDQILENYLNTIYYGRGAYGIQTAAKAYFGKDASQLDLGQAAVLASVINAPSLYDPANGAKAQERLKTRVTYVLDGMVTEGWLKPADRAAVTGPPQTIAPQKSQALHRHQRLHRRRRAQRADRHPQARRLRRRPRAACGSRRRSTRRPRTRRSPPCRRTCPPTPPTCMPVSSPIKPGDGAVFAMYGGADYQKRQISSATDAIMQAGSTFKPFALIAALQQGISTKTRIDGNSPYQVPNSTTKVPNEFDQSFGTVDLRTGLAKSINTVFMRLNERIGPPNTKNAAIAAGIPAATPGLDDNLVNVLGTSSPHVLDVANAYATIAAQGQRATPYLVAAVSSADAAGATQSSFDYKVQKQVQGAFGADVAADTLDAMQAVTQSGGTAPRAAQLGRPVAGKTGTTDGRLSVWFTGVIPQLSTSVGHVPRRRRQPQPLENIAGISELSGNSLPLSIWLDFMKTATQGMDVQDFPKRAGIGDNGITTTSTPTTTTTTAPPTTTTTTTTTPPPVTTTVTVPPVTTTTAPPTTTTTTPTRTTTTTTTRTTPPGQVSSTTTTVPTPAP